MRSMSNRCSYAPNFQCCQYWDVWTVHCVSTCITYSIGASDGIFVFFAFISCHFIQVDEQTTNGEREKKTVIPLLGTTLPSHCHVFSMLMSYFKYFYWNFIAHHKWPHTLRVVQVQFASCILNLYTHWTSIFMMLNAISMSIFLMCLYDFSNPTNDEKTLLKMTGKNKYVWLHFKRRQIHFIHIYRDIIRKKQEREREKELHLTVCKANKNIFDKQSH